MAKEQAEYINTGWRLFQAVKLTWSVAKTLTKASPVGVVITITQYGAAPLGKFAYKQTGIKVLKKVGKLLSKGATIVGDPITYGFTEVTSRVVAPIKEKIIESVVETFDVKDPRKRALIGIAVDQTLSKASSKLTEHARNAVDMGIDHLKTKMNNQVQTSGDAIQSGSSAQTSQSEMSKRLNEQPNEKPAESTEVKVEKRTPAQPREEQSPEKQIQTPRQQQPRAKKKSKKLRRLGKSLKKGAKKAAKTANKGAKVAAKESVKVADKMGYALKPLVKGADKVTRSVAKEVNHGLKRAEKIAKPVLKPAARVVGRGLKVAKDTGDRVAHSTKSIKRSYFRKGKSKFVHDQTYREYERRSYKRKLYTRKVNFEEANNKKESQGNSSPEAHDYEFVDTLVEQFVELAIHELEFQLDKIERENKVEQYYKKIEELVREIKLADQLEKEECDQVLKKKKFEHRLKLINMLESQNALFKEELERVQKIVDALNEKSDLSDKDMMYLCQLFVGKQEKNNNQTFFNSSDNYKNVQFEQPEYNLSSNQVSKVSTFLDNVVDSLSTQQSKEFRSAVRGIYNFRKEDIRMREQEAVQKLNEELKEAKEQLLHNRTVRSLHLGKQVAISKLQYEAKMRELEMRRLAHAYSAQSKVLIAAIQKQKLGLFMAKYVKAQQMSEENIHSSGMQ